MILKKSVTHADSVSLATSEEEMLRNTCRLD